MAPPQAHPPAPGDPGRAGSTTERSEGAVADQPPVRRPRGRPRGSVALTDESERIIIQYVLAGAFLEAAAQAAGISPRTLREWLARGEGTHATRSPTAKLRRFAQKVREAQAQARVGAEVRVYQQSPKYWLAHAARTTGEVPGWSDLTPAQEEGMRSDTIVDRLRQLERRKLGEWTPPVPQARQSDLYGEED